MKNTRFEVVARLDGKEYLLNNGIEACVFDGAVYYGIENPKLILEIVKVVSNAHLHERTISLTDMTDYVIQRWGKVKFLSGSEIVAMFRREVCNG